MHCISLIMAGEVKKVGEMLSQRPSLAHITDQDGATPLMFAANKGHVEVGRVAPSLWMNTPILSCYLHTQICKALLGAGAEVNAKDKVHQWTPLMQATHQRYVTTVLQAWTNIRICDFFFCDSGVMPWPGCLVNMERM